jgi:hypothetical protein
MSIIKNFNQFEEELNEKKKMNAGLAAYLDKKNGKKSDDDKDEDEDEEDEDKDTKKKKKDDGDEDEDDEKPTGLTAKQKKLPEALQKAILKRMKK